MAERIQRKRNKGWRMPANTISVTRPGRWGNPLKLKPGTVTANTREDVILSYRKWLDGSNNIGIIPPTYEEIREQLAGKNLACFCKLGSPCHADVLLEIANSYKELVYEDWHFVPHFERDGFIFGCLWKGEKPETWSLANLIRLDNDDAQMKKFREITTV